MFLFESAKRHFCQQEEAARLHAEEEGILHQEEAARLKAEEEERRLQEEEDAARLKAIEEERLRQEDDIMHLLEFMNGSDCV